MSLAPLDEPLPVVEREEEGLYRIPGVTRDELREALGAIRLVRQIGALAGDALEEIRVFAERIRAVQAEMGAERREALYQAMADLGVDFVPAATVAQARRLAASRRRLLASGAFTTADLMEMRGDRSQSATRTWLSRQRERSNLFTVEKDGTTLVPAFLLDPSGQPRREVQAPLAILREAGLGGWELWSWFASGSPWLSGQAPTEFLERDPDVVERVARAFVANLA